MLLVTGQQHAGQFIDLLGDGKVEERGGGELLFELDLTYKVQTEPGGIAQVVGMARDFAADDRLVVCLGDNIFEHAHARRSGTGTAARSSSSRTSRPRELRRGRLQRRRLGGDIVEKAGVVDTRYESPPSSDAVVGLYCYPPEVFEIVETLEPSSRGSSRSPTSTASSRRAASCRCSGSRAGGTTAASTGRDLAEVGRLIEQTGVNK